MGASLSQEDVPAWFGVVLQFASWEERLGMRYLSRAFARYYRLEYPQRLLAEALAKDFLVYVPSTLPYGYSWSRLFRELYSHRSIWCHDTGGHASARMKHRIQVFSRFKPVHRGTDGEPSLPDKRIVLPLHQRLSLIKLSNGLTSNREAIQILMSEGSWFGGLDADKENSTPSDSSALDKHRARSPNTKDLVASVHSVDPGSGKVVLITPDVGLREFSFDAVFPSNTGQRAVYQTVTAGVIMDFMNGIFKPFDSPSLNYRLGFNATILVYGQTGAGKTHTMFGSDDEAIYGSNLHGAGIVPRALHDILEAMGDRSNEVESQLFVSYVEIYGENVIDLLRGGIRCGHSKVSYAIFIL